MFTYYTHIPDSKAPTAEIAASSTKHARTTYLDYLSRNGLIGWKDRQTIRPLIKVSRMQPGEFQTQIKLDYDQRSEPPVQEVEAPPEMGVEERLEEQPPEEEPAPDSYFRAPSAPSAPSTVVTTPPSSELEGGEVTRPGGRYVVPRPKLDSLVSSPIAKLSRKSKGA